MEETDWDKFFELIRKINQDNFTADDERESVLDAATKRHGAERELNEFLDCMED